MSRRGGLLDVSKTGDELLLGYTTTSSPWLHDEQGRVRAGSTARARATLIGASRAGNKLLFGYTTAPTPWLYDEQGASRIRCETVLDDGRDERNTSSWIQAIFLARWF
jgi:hypothetical protein